MKRYCSTDMDVSSEKIFKPAVESDAAVDEVSTDSSEGIGGKSDICSDSTEASSGGGNWKRTKAKQRTKEDSQTNRGCIDAEGMPVQSADELLKYGCDTMQLQQQEGPDVNFSRALLNLPRSGDKDLQSGEGLLCPTGSGSGGIDDEAQLRISDARGEDITESTSDDGGNWKRSSQRRTKEIERDALLQKQSGEGLSFLNATEGSLPKIEHVLQSGAGLLSFGHSDNVDESVKDRQVQSGEGLWHATEQNVIEGGVFQDDDVIDVATPPDELIEIYLDKVPRGGYDSSYESEYTFIEEAVSGGSSSLGGHEICDDGYHDSQAIDNLDGSESAYEVLDEVVSICSDKSRMVGVPRVKEDTGLQSHWAYQLTDGAFSDCNVKVKVAGSVGGEGSGALPVSEDGARRGVDNSDISILEFTNDQRTPNEVEVGDRTKGGMDVAEIVPTNLIVGDSNIVRMRDLMRSVEGLRVLGVKGLGWKGVPLNLLSAFDYRNRYANIIVYIGINDVFHSDVNRDVPFGLGNLYEAINGLQPEGSYGNGHVWIIIPHVVDETDQLYEKWQAMRTCFIDFVNNLPQASGLFWEWHLEEFSTVIGEYHLLVEQFPSQKHLTPFGLERLLKMCLKYLPYSESDVHCFDEERRLHNRYRHCAIASCFSDAGRSLFREVNAAHKIYAPCYVTMVRFAELFDLPEGGRGEVVTPMECFTRTCHPLTQYRTKITTERGKGFDKRVELSGFLDALKSTLQKKVYYSTFCEVCTQYLPPDQAPFYDHIDKRLHRLSHVVFAVSKIMDEYAGGTVFDRLAFKTIYRIREVGFDMKAYKEIDHDVLLHNAMRFRMEVGVRVRTESMADFEVEVEVVHVGNLPGLVITIMGSMPLQSLELPIEVHVQIFGRSRKVAGTCRPMSAVVYCLRQGGACTSMKHATQSGSLAVLGIDGKERSIYNHVHVMNIRVFKRAGGLIYDLVEVWGGAEFHPKNVTLAPELAGKKRTVPSTPLHFLIGINYMGSEVRKASFCVIKDAKDARHCPSRSFSGHHNVSGKLEQLHTAKMDIGEFSPARSSNHLFKPFKAGHQKILDYSFRMFQGTAKKLKERVSRSDALAEEFAVYPSFTGPVDPAEVAREMHEFAKGATGLMQFSVERAFKLNCFWPFFANALGMFLLDRDGRQEIPWLIFDRVGVNEDPIDRTMKIYVNVSESRWFTGKTPECISMEYDDGGSRQKHFLRVRRVVKPEHATSGYLEIEEDTTITEPQVLDQIRKNSASIKFFHCKDIFMSLRIFTDLTQTVVSDKRLALKTTGIKGPDRDFTKPETMAKNTFRDAEDPECIEANVYHMELLRIAGRRRWEVVNFEMARFNRSRLLSAFDIIAPGAGCDDLRDNRLPAVDESLIKGFGGARSELFEESGGSMHRFIVNQVRDIPWEDGFPSDMDNRICGATPSNEDECTCRITKDSIIDVFFQKVVNAPRFALLEGPVGTGKTYILSRVVYKLVSAYEGFARAPTWIDDIWPRDWIQNRVLSPKFFVLSTTNSNVETTKEYIVDAGVDQRKMIHFVSRKQSIEEFGLTGVRKVFVPTVAEEQMTYKLLTKYIEEYQVIFSTVDLACGYLSRLRLLQNVYIFLDEAAQVSMVNGMYLMMYCDCMVLFGDPYQTEPYLDVENTVMKAYMVDVSVMELIVKALEMQGSDVKSKYCVRTYFNFRSTEPQCHLISETCYRDKHPLFSVVAENRRQTTKMFREVIPCLREVLGLNELDTAVLSVNGSMYTLPTHTHYNMEEATAVVSLLLDIAPFMEKLTYEEDPDPVTVAVLTLYDGMEQLLKIACESVFKGKLPFWLRIMSIRVSQGQTFTYVILPLIESSYSDQFVAPITRRAFTGDRRMMTVAISRQTHGLIIVTNPHRFILDDDTPVSKILRCLSERGLFFRTNHPYSASGAEFFSWIVNLNLYYPGQYEAISLTLQRLRFETNLDRDEPGMDVARMQPGVDRDVISRHPIRDRVVYRSAVVYEPLGDVPEVGDVESRFKRFREGAQLLVSVLGGSGESATRMGSVGPSGTTRQPSCVSIPVQLSESLWEATVAASVPQVPSGGVSDESRRAIGRGRGRGRDPLPGDGVSAGVRRQSVRMPTHIVPEGQERGPVELRLGRGRARGRGQVYLFRDEESRPGPSWRD